MLCAFFASVSVCVCMCVCVCVCVCVLFIMVWKITRWTRDCQPSSSPKELRAYRDGSIGKAEISHTSHTPIPLLKVDSTHSLAVKNR